jgi:hypothetical protein
MSANSDWEGVISLAAQHLLLPALWKALSRKGLAQNVPQSVKRFLSEIYVLSTERNKKIKNQALEIVTALSRATIPCILLKGGAFLFDCEPEDFGERMMVDLDLLVPQDRVPQSVIILADLGYGTLGHEAAPHHHPALFRQGEVATIEVHWSIGDDALLPPDQLFRNAIPVSASTVWIPSPSHRLIHNMFHAAVLDGGFRGGIIPLKALHDLTRIVDAHQSIIDWEEIGAAMRRRGFGRVLEAHLYLANRLLNWSPPSTITPTWRAAVHYRRCLAFNFIRQTITPHPRASLRRLASALR